MPASRAGETSGGRRTLEIVVSAGRLGEQPAQLGLENLAGVVFGQRFDKTIVRALEANDVVEVYPVECLGRGVSAGADGKINARNLAQFSTHNMTRSPGSTFLCF